MSLKINFGKRIKELRESLLMSQEAFAEKIGVHRNTLARIESGENFVSLATLENIKTALNVEYEDLFTFNNEIKKDHCKAFYLKFNELNEADAKYFLTNINAYLKAKQENSKNDKNK